MARSVAMQSLSRRSFLSSSVAGLGWLGKPTLAWRRGEPRADAVIHIHLAGGLSHLDSFDPKPEAPVEVRGPFATIKSKADGEPLSELLGRTAKVADKLTVIRSVTHTEADHDRGAHSMLTGFAPSPAIVYPSFGAVVAHELGSRNDLPAYVCVPAPNSEFLGTGYLGSAHGPFAVGGNPATNRFRVRDLSPARPLDDARAARRKRLLHDLDADHQDLREADAVAASEAFYRQAYALIESPRARAAFDLGAEPEPMKDRYGRRRLGMSCLLARRLVQGGARYVVVTGDGFDHHTRIQSELPPRLDEVDQAFAALLADLDALGLLQRTMVLLTTEFGRTPRLNGDSGRDHWSRVFSVALAGGGVKRGYVHGRSNATGAEVEEHAVSPADLAATAFSALGLEIDKRLMAAGGRPIDVVRDGRVLTEVLA